MLIANRYEIVKEIGKGGMANVYKAVDNLRYDGVKYRTVSGWKHSSPKAIVSGMNYQKGDFLIVKISLFCR